MKIGITGQQGFIGSHLYNYLNLQEGIELVEFNRAYFSDIDLLEKFVVQCEVIVHLAAMNRHESQEYIYEVNVDLVNKLVIACENKKVNPHILISSSTQEERDNLYGKSKRDGRELIENWAKKNDALSSGLIIPNVFGPFGKPNYNSVVATFCSKLINNEQPEIHVDGDMKVIYVNKLVEHFYDCIKNKKTGRIAIPHQYEIKVSELLDKLDNIKQLYFVQGEFPSLEVGIDKDLFNTFRCYIPHDYYPRRFTQHKDPRGAFVEIVRANTSGQFSFSTTVPGITRGNHFHTRKAERFAVIKGKAEITLRKVDSEEVIRYVLDGENPAYVDMPIWYTHNIKNIGDEELLTLFWINEPYDEKDADTYFVNV